MRDNSNNNNNNVLYSFRVETPHDHTENHTALFVYNLRVSQMWTNSETIESIAVTGMLEERNDCLRIEIKI